MYQNVRYIEIPDDREGQRIDNYLMLVLKGVPKSHIYRLMRKGEVRVNKKRIKPTYRLQAGDSLRLPPVRLAAPKDKKIIKSDLLDFLESRILYEDDALLVMNKPSGLAVHGGSGIDLGMIEALRAMRPQCDNLELVHRLDRETSGCLLIAKKRAVLRELHQHLANKTFKKTYTALLKGQWSHESNKHTVDAPLKKNVLLSGERIVRVNPTGKESRTKFCLIKQFKESCLVKAMPVTGRTHQIRVHALSMGLPIVGDKKYGSEDAKPHLSRLFLHAANIAFKLSGYEDVMRFEAPLDEKCLKLLEDLE